MLWLSTDGTLLRRDLWHFVTPGAQFPLDFFQGNAGWLLETARRVSGSPRMGEYHLVRRGQSTVLPELFIGRLHCGELARTGEAPRPGCRGIVRAGRLQVRSHLAHVKILQGKTLHIEHRRREAVAHQRIAQIMHVDELMDVAVSVDLSPGGAQFAQGVGAEGAE